MNKAIGGIFKGFKKYSKIIAVCSIQRSLFFHFKNVPDTIVLTTKKLAVRNLDSRKDLYFKSCSFAGPDKEIKKTYNEIFTF